MIVQNVSQDGRCNLSFTRSCWTRDPGRRSDHANCRRANPRSSQLWPSFRSLAWGLLNYTGVATRMFALADRSININLINTSEIRINVGTDVAKGKEGLDCLREVFALNQES